LHAKILPYFLLYMQLVKNGAGRALMFLPLASSLEAGPLALKALALLLWNV
jgi:hypothetical protein